MVVIVAAVGVVAIRLVGAPVSVATFEAVSVLRSDTMYDGWAANTQTEGVAQ